VIFHTKIYKLYSQKIIMDIDYLKSWSEQIGRIDHEILFLLKRRFQILKKVAKYIKDNDLEFDNQIVKDEILKRVVSKGISMGMNENFIREVFNEILKEDEKKQKIFLEEYESKNK